MGSGKSVAIVGLGEVGKPLFELVSKFHSAVGVDISLPPSLPLHVDVLHVCFPFEIKDFVGEDSINRAGSTDPEKIREAIKATNIPGDKLITPWRGIKFDEKGQNILVDAIVIQYQDGGKRYTIYPFNLATKDIVYPIPRWSQRK